MNWSNRIIWYARGVESNMQLTIKFVHGNTQKEKAFTILSQIMSDHTDSYDATI